MRAVGTADFATLTVGVDAVRSLSSRLTRRMRIALIVSTYERPDALAAVLDSVARQRAAPDEIVIADDGSGSADAAI